MRTIEEIQAQIVKHEGTAREYDQADYVHDCDVADNMGMIAGFNAGLRQIERGQNSLDIARGAWVDAAAYRSCGNDDEDSYQIGFTRAIGSLNNSTGRKTVILFSARQYSGRAGSYRTAFVIVATRYRMSQCCSSRSLLT